MASSSMEAADRLSMPPPAPRPALKRKQVLEEDVYAGTIEAIVERDFFPHLPKLQNQLEWLQAVQSGDPGLIKRAQLNIARRRAGLRTPLAHEGGGSGTPGTAAITPGTALLHTPAMTPHPGVGAAAAVAAGAATPGLLGAAGARTPAGPAAAVALQQQQGLDPVSAQQAVGARAPAVSLDQFFAEYQGEDNASFHELHESTLARKRARMAHHLQDKNTLLLEAAPGSRVTDEYGTSGQERDVLRFAQHTPKNALYYDSSQQPVLALTAAEKATIVAGPPKVINHKGTRSLQEDAAEAEAAAAAGGGLLADGQQQQGGSSKAGAATAPGTRGYGYMRTPQIVPGVDASPIMTWGDIASTPLRLEGQAAGGGGLEGSGFDLGLDDYDEEEAAAAAKQFTLPEVRSREAKAQQMMAARAARARRGVLAGRGGGSSSLGRVGGGSTPLMDSLRRSIGSGTPNRPGSKTPSSTTPGLSAAALKLAQQLRRPGTGQREGSSGGSGGGALPGDLPGLRASYQRGGHTPARTPTGTTPRSWDATTPSRGLGSGSTGGNSMGQLQQPGGSSVRVQQAAAPPTSAANITDDLLKLK